MKGMRQKVLIVGTDQQRIERWRSVAHDCLEQAVVVDSALLELAQNAPPSFCLLDIASINDVQTEDVLRYAQLYPGLKFIVLVAVPESLDGIEWLRAGAKAYVNRLASDNVLGSVLQSLSRGEIWAGKQVVQHLLLGLQQQAENRRAISLDVLTERQRELAGYIANGLLNKQIAQKLGITERTVKSHLSNIFRKLNLSSRVQLALAVEQQESSNHNRKISAA